MAQRQAPEAPWTYTLYEVFASDNPDALSDGPLPRTSSLAALESTTRAAGDGEVRYFALDPALIDEPLEALLPGGVYEYTIEAAPPLPFVAASGTVEPPAQALVLRPRPTPTPNANATVPVYIQFVPRMRGTVRPAAPTATAYDPATQAISRLTAGWTQTLPPPTEASYSIYVVLASLLTFAGPGPDPLPFRSAGPPQKLRGPWGERVIYRGGWGIPSMPHLRPLSMAAPTDWGLGDLGANGYTDGQAGFHYLRQQVGRIGAADPRYPDDASWVASWLPGLPRRPAGLFSREVTDPAWSDDDAGLAIANGLPRISLDSVFGRTTPDRWAESISFTDCAPWVSALPDGPLPPGSFLLAFSEKKDGRLEYRTQPRRLEYLLERDWARYNDIQRFETEAQYGPAVSLFISRRTKDGQPWPVDLVARITKDRGWGILPLSVGLRWTGRVQGTEHQRIISYHPYDVRVDARHDAWRVTMSWDNLSQGYNFSRAMADTIDILFTSRIIPTYRLGVPGDTVILHHASGWTDCRRMVDQRVWAQETSTLGADLADKLYDGGG